MGQDEIQVLREENAALREENARLRALVADLLPLKTQVEELSTQLKQVESRQAKDSHNSPLPPSSDRFTRAAKTNSLRKPSGKKPGAQPGHEGNTLYQLSSPDQIIVPPVEAWAWCQQDLQAEPVLQIERRQVWDIPPKRVVLLDHQAQQHYCPHCQQITKAAFPEGVCAPVQYGPAFGARAVYLVQDQLLPSERACETIQDLIGPSMTLGTLKRLIERCAQQLEPVEQEIKEHLRQAEVLHQDETALDVMGKRIWMHVSATSTLTHYAVQAKRGQQALEAIGILPGFGGISVHDGWTSDWLYGCLHARCNAHHLRELTFLGDHEHQEWAAEMKSLWCLLNEAVPQAKTLGLKQLDPTEVADWKAHYEAVLQQGWPAHPPAPPAVDAIAKRGRRKQSAARNLLTRLSTPQDAVLRFLEDFRVPFDTRQAERDLRMVKVQHKISGGFRSLAGAQAFCRIRGYLSPLRKQGGQLLTALELALAGPPVSPAF